MSSEPNQQLANQPTPPKGDASTTEQQTNKKSKNSSNNDEDVQYQTGRTCYAHASVRAMLHSWSAVHTARLPPYGLLVKVVLDKFGTSGGGTDQVLEHFGNPQGLLRADPTFKLSKFYPYLLNKTDYFQLPKLEVRPIDPLSFFDELPRLRNAENNSAVMLSWCLNRRQWFYFHEFFKRTPNGILRAAHLEGEGCLLEPSLKSLPGMMDGGYAALVDVHRSSLPSSSSSATAATTGSPLLNSTTTSSGAAAGCTGGAVRVKNSWGLGWANGEVLAIESPLTLAPMVAVDEIFWKEEDIGEAEEAPNKGDAQLLSLRKRYEEGKAAGTARMQLLDDDDIEIDELLDAAAEDQEAEAERKKKKKDGENNGEGEEEEDSMIKRDPTDVLLPDHHYRGRYANDVVSIHITEPSDTLRASEKKIEDKLYKYSHPSIVRVEGFVPFQEEKSKKKNKKEARKGSSASEEPATTEEASADRRLKMYIGIVQERHDAVATTQHLRKAPRVGCRIIRAVASALQFLHKAHPPLCFHGRLTIHSVFRYGSSWKIGDVSSVAPPLDSVAAMLAFFDEENKKKEKQPHHHHHHNTDVEFQDPFVAKSLTQKDFAANVNSDDLVAMQLRADVYALGKMLEMFLAGNTTASSTTEEEASKTASPPPLNEEIKAKLTALLNPIVAKCCDSSNKGTTASALVTEVLSVLDEVEEALRTSTANTNNDSTNNNNDNTHHHVSFSNDGALTEEESHHFAVERHHHHNKEDDHEHNTTANNHRHPAMPSSRKKDRRKSAVPSTPTKPAWGAGSGVQPGVSPRNRHYSGHYNTTRRRSSLGSSLNRQNMMPARPATELPPPSGDAQSDLALKLLVAEADKTVERLYERLFQLTHNNNEDHNGSGSRRMSSSANGTPPPPPAEAGEEGGSGKPTTTTTAEERMAKGRELLAALNAALAH